MTAKLLKMSERVQDVGLRMFVILFYCAHRSDRIDVVKLLLCEVCAQQTTTVRVGVKWGFWEADTSHAA